MSSAIYYVISRFNLGNNEFEHYYFWAVCCFCNVFAIFNHLNQFKLVSETFSIIVLAIEMNYPFLFVFLMTYMIFAVVGCFLFGGVINSKTPDRMAEIGQATKDIYKYHNWNDYLNSLVYLYSINLQNNLPLYVNMSALGDGDSRSYKGIFFFVFFVLNNVILRNIFIGQIIEISLSYFKIIDAEARNLEIIEVSQSASRALEEELEGEDNKLLRVKI